MEKNESELLETLGLSGAEVAVYLATLELGQGHIQDISRKSGVKRTSIYNFIDQLKERQLLTEIKKGKRKLYLASDPRSLIDQSRSRTTSLERLIPQLLAVSNSVHNKPRVSFYEGVDGMKEVYAMTLRDKQTIYSWEDFDRMFAMLGNFFNTYPVERTKKKIPFRSIIRDTKFARDFVATNNERLMRDSRFISSEEFGTEINIFGKKVAFFSLRKDFPFGVVIEDEGIAKTLMVAWTELWNRLPPSSNA